MLSDLAMGGPTRDAATEVFLRELPSIAEQGAVLILDDFHLVDESPDVRLDRARARGSRPGATVDRVRESAHADRPAGAAACVRRGRRDRDRRPPLRRRRDRAAVQRDVRSRRSSRTSSPTWPPGPRAGPRRSSSSRPRCATGRRPRSASSSRGLSGADHGALRLPRRGGRRRPAGRPPAVPHADVDPPGRHGRSRRGRDRARCGRRRAAHRRCRAPDPADPPQPHQSRATALPSARARIPGGQAAAVVERGGRRRRSTVASPKPPQATTGASAAYHFREAGDHAAVAETIAAAIPEIMGSGSLRDSRRIHRQDARRTSAGCFRSGDVTGSNAAGRLRRGIRRGSTCAVRRAAGDRARPRSPEPTDATHQRRQRGGCARTRGPLARSDDGSQPEAHSSKPPGCQSRHGAPRVISTRLRPTSGSWPRRQRDVHSHHFGVTMLNLGLVSILQDRPLDALAEFDEAADALESSSASIEMSSLFVMRAAVLAQVGRLVEAGVLVDGALDRPDLRAEADLVLEAAEYEDSYGDPDRATTFLDEADSLPALSLKHRWVRALVGARYCTRRRRYEEAQSLLAAITNTDATSPGLGVARLVDRAHLASAMGDFEALSSAEEARRAAHQQRAHRARRLAELLVAFETSDEELSIAIASIGSRSPWHLTYLADLLARRTAALNGEAIEAIQSAMHTHPRRWRQALRLQLDVSSGPSKLSTGRLLESIGDQSDIRRLRAAGRSMRRVPGAAELGRGLARRLAPRVEIGDLGRISVTVGAAIIPGTSIRRRVLALLGSPTYASRLQQHA